MTALVQALLHNATGGFISSVTATGTKTVTVGNYIYVLVGTPDPANGVGVTDNLGNVYSSLYEYETPIGSGSNQQLAFLRAPVTVGGTLTSIMAGWGGIVTGGSICSAEFSDASGTPGGTAEGASGSAVTSLGVTLGGTVSGLLFWNLTTFGNISAFVPPTGFTLADSGEVGSSSVNQVFMCFKVGSAGPGTLTASWSNGRGCHAVASSIDVPPPPMPRLSFDNIFVP